jgi:hypothetical protein
MPHTFYDCFTLRCRSRKQFAAQGGACSPSCKTQRQRGLFTEGCKSPSPLVKANQEAAACKWGIPTSRPSTDKSENNMTKGVSIMIKSKLRNIKPKTKAPAASMPHETPGHSSKPKTTLLKPCHANESKRKPLSTHVVTRSDGGSVATTDVKRLHTNDAVLCPLQHLDRNVTIHRQAHVVVPMAEVTMRCCNNAAFNSFELNAREAPRRKQEKIMRWYLLGLKNFGSKTAPPLYTCSSSTAV